MRINKGVVKRKSSVFRKNVQKIEPNHMVGVTRLERAIPASQMPCGTNSATPRYSILLLYNYTLI